MMKGFTFTLIGITLLFFSCQSELDKKDLIGKWKVTNMKVDIPNVPAQIIENAKILSLSTVYEFSDDMTFRMEIVKNERENGRKQIGRIEINDALLTLAIDTVFLRNNNDEWVNVEKRDSGFFDPIIMSIEKKIEKPNYVLRKGRKWKNLLYAQ
ncbi:hypothetical protein LVD15_12070 [Fulvivirga maritima]|uniref:hypothetical protein n=1 Tax=Fulvivirga maritima TaxID=2904247 RepID=UPI001F2A306E|nr:hypothetical protein [Fulvivirga maritima]UII29131.1 hypothetical protein LVD15_12070 [Fulvivirga maritima]